MKRVGALAFVAVAVGCGTPRETDPSARPKAATTSASSLGIARFEVHETRVSSTVIARDAAGAAWSVASI